MFAVSAAALLAHHVRCAGAKDVKENELIKVLNICGWILAILEIYKQLFLYYIVNRGAYDWWYFPFQLCSVPMYLCVLLPFARGRLHDAFLTFMSSYTFISAVAALIYPEDFLRPYVALTLHGFIWHGILLFISLMIWLSGAALTPNPAEKMVTEHPANGKGSQFRMLLSAACLFFILCVAAVLINMAVEPVMQTTFAAHRINHSYAAMFYLNPYHISPQPIIGNVQRFIGIPLGLIIYSFVIIVVSSLFSIAVKHFMPRK